jgi:hypothetical protein
MKAATLACVLLSLACGTSFAGVVTDIPSSDQVILKTDEATWTPTKDQTRDALFAIQAYLELNNAGKKADPASDASQIPNILANKHGYRVQFWGIQEKDSPAIYCNFFPSHGDPDEFANWRRERVRVIDGGCAFWFAKYDPKAKKVIMFMSNGEAMRQRFSSQARYLAISLR